MRPSSIYSIAFAGLLVVGSALPAFAGEAQRLSDSDYLNAARCAGIAQGLGEDTKGYDKMLDREAGGRDNGVVEQAVTFRDDGARLAHRTDAKAKARVAVEHDGFCRSYVNVTMAAR